MQFKPHSLSVLLGILLLFISCQVTSGENDFTLHIHIHYQQAEDAWKVTYALPIAVDHVAFSRNSNFDRRNLYTVDPAKFKWDQAGDILLIRSVDGSQFKSLELTFNSYYDFIQKDYTHNVKFTDGSVLLYTNHLALGANIIDDKTISPIGASFGNTQFHFYAPDQNIAFLGRSYNKKAEWLPDRDGTYVYFGNIPAIETDNLLAIVDPQLPKWVWDATQKYFPKLFNYYADKTDQPLSFKPIVFFNYDQLHGNFSNYSGGTLDGLVQLTMNGKRWEKEDSELFNKLFYFLAHEAAHFWNGEMFSVDGHHHAWLHEGGADAFAYFAMHEFGLLSTEQMMLKFEDAANRCILDKGKESLEQSANLGRYRNYYTCGAAMALASHLAIRAKAPEKSVFDVWKGIFHSAMESKIYGQNHYFAALEQLTGSSDLSKAFERFSSETDLDNSSEIASWFDHTEVTISFSYEYPAQMKQHWGRQIIRHLMHMHCGAISVSSYDDHLETHPLESCHPFDRGYEIHYVEGLEIFGDGAAAYQLFRDRCQGSASVSFQNRDNEPEVAIPCLRVPTELRPYLRFNRAQLIAY